MPLYDFECLSCGYTFEELVTAKEENPICPQCKHTETTSKMSAPSPLKTGAFPYKPGRVMPKAPRTQPACGSANKGFS